MISKFNKWTRQLVTARDGGAGEPSAVSAVKSVLITEDDAQVRAYAALVVHALGYEVIQAESGPEALTIIRSRRDNPIDLLMTDLMMPAMSGKDLADRLWRKFPMQRVLFFSGYPEHMARQRWKLPPEMAFLQKPFSSQALATKVRQLLDPPVDRLPATVIIPPGPVVRVVS